MLLSYDYDVLTGRNSDDKAAQSFSPEKKDQSTSWSPSSWKHFPAEQLPEYPDKYALSYFQNQLKNFPPLVLASEINHLKSVLSLATEGKAFILQGGDCAESFSSQNSIVTRDFMYTFNQMAGLIHQSNHLPIIKIGRIAGQYAKPRSSSHEEQNGIKLPSYKGEIINGLDFSERSRAPDPQRMVHAYHHSSATLNLIRAINSSVNREYDYKLHMKVYPWSTERDHYVSFLEELYKTSHYLFKLEGISKPLYTSHEALLLPYEEALTRKNSADNKWYNCSAHMVWVGERTRNISQAHIEYLRGIENPIGIKCGPAMNSSDLIQLITKINPNNESGKIILIIRMGADTIKEKLPALLKAVKQKGLPVIWMIDPMHGNTKSTDNGYKTRHFTDISNEMTQFIGLLNEENLQPGGLHLEMTGQEVTECSGGLQEINVNDLSYKYRSLCDPRLNRMQSLELAYLFSRSWIK